MKERKQYTKEFKQGAVRLVTEQGRSVADVSRSLGIPSWSLSRWIRAAREDGSEAFRGNGPRTAQEQEIFELRQRVKQLEEETQILKKCMAPPPGSSAERIVLAQGWTDAANVSGFCDEGLLLRALMGSAP